jgi:hypothetical protein
MQPSNARLNEDTGERSEGNLVVSILEAVRIRGLSETPLLLEIDADIVQFDFYIRVIVLE